MVSIINSIIIELYIILVKAPVKEFRDSYIICNYLTSSNLLFCGYEVIIV